MPAISLVVCVYQQRDLLARLLREATGCFDELLVIHDGPEPSVTKSNTGTTVPSRLPALEFPELAVDFANPEDAAVGARFWRERVAAAGQGSVYELVRDHGGRFFEGPRSFTHECQWPFAWSRCTHDWILLLDSDEFPSPELKLWLMQFRAAPAPEKVSGYRCIWPLWDGKSRLSDKYPPGRLFLIHRQRIRYIGMGENRPRPDFSFQDLNLILEHQPKRRSYGLRNVFRKDGVRWRRRIAEALLANPLQLSRWRWDSEIWPPEWEEIRRRPLYTGFKRIGIGTLRSLRDQWRIGKKLFPIAAISSPIYHFLICLEYRRQRQNAKKSPVHD